ncbi:MAG: P-loop NTPase [Lachnospiraceae bacterium]|nr:P-loop NTPase [Lachnospiraceae bacterium]
MDQATNLRVIKASQIVKPTARVITVTSGKGGVGKSNTAINLAIHFKKMGKRVIILDADFGLANIEIMFGAVPKYNFSDLIYKGMGIRDIITWGPMDVGFISGGSGIAKMNDLGRENLMYIINNLAELDSIADIVIVDTGAGIGNTVLEFLVASDEIILVTTPEPTSITDSYSLLKSLGSHVRFNRGVTQVKMLANKVMSENDGEILYRKLNSVVERYLNMPMEYLGNVPFDNQLAESVMQQSPVVIKVPNSRSAMAYERIANKLLGNESANVKSRGMAAFFSHIMGGNKL